MTPKQLWYMAWSAMRASEYGLNARKGDPKFNRLVNDAYNARQRGDKLAARGEEYYLFRQRAKRWQIGDPPSAYAFNCRCTVVSL